MMYEYDEMYEYNEEDGGIQFQPYDDELINKYLIPKLEGKPREEITTKDVYSKEPWLLDHPMGSFFKKNEWYYFVTRTQLAKNNIGCGKKVKRKITREEDSGVWRANAKDNITDKETKMLIGEKQSLAFVKSRINSKKLKRGDGTCCDVVLPPGSDSSWIMTEYMLPEIEGKFRELVICKIHVIENPKKKKGHDDRHEASTSSYHHHHIDPSTSEQQPINVVDHGTFVAPILEQQQMNLSHQHIGPSTLEQHPINIVDHGTSLAPFWEKQPMNLYHHHIDSSTLEQQPINTIDHRTSLAPFLEQQPMDLSHHHIDPSTLEQQPINNVYHGTSLAPFWEQQPMNLYHHHHIDSSTLEQQPINNVYHGTSLASFWEQQPMNLYHHHIDPFALEQQPINIVDHGTFRARFLEQQPTNIVCHEAFIPHHHEFIADYSTKQQPVNEAHGHVPEIPLIGSEKNDQVLIEATRQVSKKNEQLYIDAPVGCLGSQQEAEEEEEGGDRIQELINSLSAMNGLGLPMEEDDGLLNYDTPFIDQDLLDQYATLRPQEKL